MIRIKLTTTDPDFPLIRQTPNSEGIWGDCVFYLNREIEECDYWVIFDNLNTSEKTICPKENIILFTGEPPSMKRYNRSFTDQFHTVVTCNKGIKHANVIFSQQALPWMAGARYLKNEHRWDSQNFIFYNDFVQNDNSDKSKEISIIVSNKTITEGHEARIRFLNKLKVNFGDRIELFGRGFNEIEDKFDSIAKYKYSIVLENSLYNDYWTEKLADTFLCNSFPIYYGCPNIHDYFPEESYSVIDINNIEESINTIRSIIESGRYENSLDFLKKSKDLVLNKYNLFPTIVNLINNLKKRTDQAGKKVPVKIFPQRNYRQILKKIVMNLLPD